MRGEIKEIYGATQAFQLKIAAHVHTQKMMKLSLICHDKYWRFGGLHGQKNLVT